MPLPRPIKKPNGDGRQVDQQTLDRLERRQSASRLPARVELRGNGPVAVSPPPPRLVPAPRFAAGSSIPRAVGRSNVVNGPGRASFNPSVPRVAAPVRTPAGGPSHLSSPTVPRMGSSSQRGDSLAARPKKEDPAGGKISARTKRLIDEQRPLTPYKNQNGLDMRMDDEGLNALMRQTPSTERSRTSESSVNRGGRSTRSLQTGARPPSSAGWSRLRPAPTVDLVYLKQQEDYLAMLEREQAKSSRRAAGFSQPTASSAAKGQPNRDIPGPSSSKPTPSLFLRFGARSKPNFSSTTTQSNQVPTTISPPKATTSNRNRAETLHSKPTPAVSEAKRATMLATFSKIKAKVAKAIHREPKHEYSDLAPEEARAQRIIDANDRNRARVAHLFSSPPEDPPAVKRKKNEQFVLNQGMRLMKRLDRYAPDTRQPQQNSMIRAVDSLGTSIQAYLVAQDNRAEAGKDFEVLQECLKIVTQATNDAAEDLKIAEERVDATGVTLADKTLLIRNSDIGRVMKSADIKYRRENRGEDLGPPESIEDEAEEDYYERIGCRSPFAAKKRAILEDTKADRIKSAKQRAQNACQHPETLVTRAAEGQSRVKASIVAANAVIQESEQRRQSRRESKATTSVQTQGTSKGHPQTHSSSFGLSNTTRSPDGNVHVPPQPIRPVQTATYRLPTPTPGQKQDRSAGLPQWYKDNAIAQKENAERELMINPRGRCPQPESTSGLTPEQSLAIFMERQRIHKEGVAKRFEERCSAESAQLLPQRAEADQHSEEADRVLSTHPNQGGSQASRRVRDIPASAPVPTAQDSSSYSSRGRPGRNNRGAPAGPQRYSHEEAERRARDRNSRTPGLM